VHEDGAERIALSFCKKVEILTLSKNDHLFWKLFSMNCRMGLRSFVKGLDYYRAREYQLLLMMMQEAGPLQGKRVLDLACGEEVLPVFLSNWMGGDIHASDLDMGRISLQARFFEKLRERQDRVNLTRTDALRTGYKDGSFDIVINLAVISLFEGEDPRRLVQEMARILRPRGRAYLSVGYSRIPSEGYDAATRCYFRCYDEAELTKNIIEPSGLVEVQRKYFGEPGFRFARYWYHLPFALRLFFRWAMPLSTLFFCKEIPGNGTGCAAGVLLELQKQ